ncbi:MAG: hypothetical protein K0U74_01580 [Alphaproteobacteria bacterium]|nr:hypothetical protein [Alphaproteobacteria bacterium]
MNLDRENFIFGGVCGAVLGAGYLLGKGWWINDYSDATAANLILYALIGAVGGVLAFAVRS